MQLAKISAVEALITCSLLTPFPCPSGFGAGSSAPRRCWFPISGELLQPWLSDIILYCATSLALRRSTSYDLTTLRRVIYRCAFSDSVLTPQKGQLNTGVGTVMRAIGRRLLSRLGAVWVLSHIIMVLLGTLFPGTWSRTWIGVGLAEGIGGSLIASGVAGVSLFLYVSFTDTLRAQIETISKAGLSTIYSGRSVQIRDAYHHRLTAARKIDLIGYGLSSFRQDYLEHFVDWSRRAQVRILLIDPDFPTPETSLADQRDREEQYSPGKNSRRRSCIRRCSLEALWSQAWPV